MNNKKILEQKEAVVLEKIYLDKILNNNYKIFVRYKICNDDFLINKN